MDEFGRDRSDYEENAKQRRIAEREGRRQRRRKMRDKKGKEFEDHHEGMSSDDEELETEKLRFNADKSKFSILFLVLLFSLMMPVISKT